jgi:hypothetical protein
MESRGMTLPQSDAPATAEAVIARVLTDARRSYGDKIDPELLSIWAESAVTELWGDSVKVTTFLPVLAMRRIREVAEAQQSAG